MIFSIYDSLSKKNITLPDQELYNIYFCGPTLYRKPHIGNFRTYIYVCVMRNLLLFFDKKYKIVTNITDIGYIDGNDPCLSEAIASKKSFMSLVADISIYYFKALTKLNVHIFQHIPASSLIPTYIQHIKDCCGVGTMQQVPDGYIVPIDGMLSSAFLDQKKRLKNFYSWKSDSDITFNQEFPGSPGWHIECYQIIKKHFTKNERGFLLDIHLGGIDLLDIHHNAEIVHCHVDTQSYLLSQYWAHIGHVKYNGSKLSKSTGNILYLEDLLEKISVCEIKLLMLSADMYSSINITDIGLSDIQRKRVNLVSGLASYFASYVDNFALGEFYKQTLSQINYSAIKTIIVGKTIYELFNMMCSLKLLSFDDYSLFVCLDQILDLKIVEEFVSNNILVVELQYYLFQYQHYKAQKDFINSDKVRNFLASKQIFLLERQDGIFGFKK